MADNATLARSLYDSWNERDFDAQADAATPDSRIVMVGKVKSQRSYLDTGSMMTQLGLLGEQSATTRK